MEVLKNKFLVKLIASICLVVTLLSFSTSSKVYAADSDDKLWGGVLLTPIIQLLTATGDLVMNILHESVQDQDIVIFEINGHQEWWEKVAGLLSIAWGIFVAAVIISVVVLATGGIAAGAAALAVGTATAAKSAFVFAVAAAAGGAIIAGTTGGVGAGLAIKEKMIPENIELPAFSITAEQIFRNELLLFDVNFFNPMDDKTITTDKKVDNFQMLLRENINWILEEEGKQNYTNIDIKMSNMKNAFNSYIKLPLDSLEIYSDSLEDEADPNAIYTDYIKDRIKKKELYQKLASEENWQNMYIWLSQDNKLYKLESVEVFGMNNNKINLYSAQIDQKTINSIKDSIDGYETKTIKSTAAQLQGIVSKWYVMLRNVALLVLMLLLIYSGIRIVIGSTAGEKAKYKERLMDWLVGICLIFVMQYIMVFATEMVERVTNLIGKTVNGNMVYLELSQVQMDNAKEVLAGFDTTSAEDGIANVFDDNYKGNAAGALVWPTDLAGLFRIQAQLTGAGTNAWAGYSLCYLVLVLFTLFFAFTYLKRVLYMAFLTIIAPLVAMTYPLDKITDGKAQAFDAWLKEYIFNLMIQPLHLLLYTILVSSAFALASESPIYALVAIGFMMPAEKLMRRFFGFEKAKTP